MLRISRAYCSVVLLTLLLVGALHGTLLADTIPLHAQLVAPRTVSLQWNAVDEPVSVFRQYPDQDAPQAIGTTTDASFTDHHHRAVCGDTVRYSILAGQHEGYAALFVDDAEPTAPASWGIVTIDEPTQEILLLWNPSPDTDIMGYLVCEGSPSIAIDTVYGRDNTDYIFSHGLATTPFQFRICAFDTCRQASPLTETANNMVLRVDVQPCSRTVAASWNAYQSMPSGLLGYQLWVSEDNAPFCVRQSVAHDVTSVSFDVSDRCQYLQAYVVALSYDSTLQASSNRIVYTFGTAERPAYLYLRKVSVSDDATAVHLLGQTDPTFSGRSYNVYRRVGEGAPSLVGHCSPLPDGQLSFSDRSVYPDQQLCTYWFGVLDGCGRNEIFSQQATSILPRLGGVGDEITVCWNAYDGWQGATSYQLLSSPVGQDRWEIVASGVDTVARLSHSISEGQRRFKVVASEATNSQHHHSDTLQSATVFFRPHTNLWMPNAFTPTESGNNILVPRAAYINPDGYSFVVFTRSGLVVFSTTDPLQGWDGRHEGALMPQAAYLYRITYRQSDGTIQQQLGSVLLLH